MGGGGSPGLICVSVRSGYSLRIDFVNSATRAIYYVLILSALRAEVFIMYWFYQFCDQGYLLRIDFVNSATGGVCYVLILSILRPELFIMY